MTQHIFKHILWQFRHPLVPLSPYHSQMIDHPFMCTLWWIWLTLGCIPPPKMTVNKSPLRCTLWWFWLTWVYEPPPPPHPPTPDDWPSTHGVCCDQTALTSVPFSPISALIDQAFKGMLWQASLISNKKRSGGGMWGTWTYSITVYLWSDI
jgi:hypothetical protein